ncbi:hypothetical protein D3C81_1343450 [compost metagenome]
MADKLKKQREFQHKRPVSALSMQFLRKASGTAPCAGLVRAWLAMRPAISSSTAQNSSISTATGRTAASRSPSGAHSAPPSAISSAAL